MRVDVTYSFKCTASGCDVTDVDHRSDVWSQRIPPPRLPTGWQLFRVLVFCPRHTLLLQVDGQEQEVPYNVEEG